MRKRGDFHLGIGIIVVLVVAIALLIWFLTYSYPSIIKITKGLGTKGEELLQSLPPGLTLDEATELDNVRKLALEGNCDEAKEKLEKLAGKSKEKEREANRWREVGDCYNKKGELDKALSAYNEAKNLVKDNSGALANINRKMYEVYYTRAKHDMQLNNFYRSYKDYERVMQSNYEDLKTNLDKEAKKIYCFYYYLIPAYEAMDNEEYTTVLSTLMYEIIERRPESVCVGDAKEKIYLICHIGLTKDGLKIIDKLDGDGKEFCKEADANQDRYYTPKI